MNKRKRWILCLILPLLFGTVVFGQNRKVTLSVRNAAVLECIREIERQTPYTFTFSDSVVSEAPRVSVDCRGAALPEVLDKVFSQAGIAYEISGNQIVLKARPDAQAPLRETFVTGRILDKDGVPVTGVAVQDTKHGGWAISDPDGRFSLPFKGKTTLLLSCLGYEDARLEVQGPGPVAITLEETRFALDELVVVGYGSQKKVNLTGAISTVSAKDLENRTAPTLTHMLQGSVPGLNVTTSSGRPGNTASINIRGYNSITGGSPLVLVDGAEGDLSRVNPADVENISIIKDASSSAIYGARAAFGVILVTTRQGADSDGKATVRYNGRFGWGAPTVSTDYETRGYFSVYLNDLFFRANSGYNYSKYTDDDMYELWIRRNDRTENPERPWTVIDQRDGRSTYVYYANTDWFHHFFRDVTPSMNHNISLSGGNKGLKYYVSAAYDRTEGIYRRNSDVQNKYNFRSRLSFPVNKWSDFSLNTSFFASDYTYPGVSDVNTAFNQTTTHALASIPVSNPDGTSIDYTSMSNYNVANGYLTILDKGMHVNRDVNETFSTTAEYAMRPVKGLELKVDFTYSLNAVQSMHRRVNTTYSQYPGVVSTLDTGLSEDSLTESRNKNRFLQADAYATYGLTLKDRHNFKATAGFSYETRRYADISAKGYYLFSEHLSDLDLLTDDPVLLAKTGEAGKKTEVGGGQNEYAIEGFFGRLNYDFAGRYLLEGNLRFDGTSRFARGHRWGFFPSASGGWRISEEPFFAPLRSWWDNLKIRYSFGSLGNQQVGYYDYIRTVSIGDQTYLFGGDSKPTIATLAAPNSSDLTWENVVHQNLGVDMAFLGNRLTFTAEAYIRDTRDMLTEGVSLPAVYGADSPKMNSADLRTKGYELTLGWRDSFKLWGSDFNYGATFVLSDYISKITKFDNPEKLFAKDYYVGMTIGEIWGYKTGGLFASDEEAASYPVDQSAVNQLIIGQYEHGLHAGDLKYLDLDGDGKVSKGEDRVDKPGDRVILGNSRPRFNYGLTLNAAWQGIDFSIFFQGIGRMDWYPPANAILFWGPYVRPYATYIPRNFHTMIWTEENPDAYFPRPRGHVARTEDCELSTINDRYLQNIAYCRLKNLTVGYTLPRKWTLKAGIQTLRVYFSGENLAYLSPGLKSVYVDPEQAQTGTTLRQYPWRKTCLFGIDLTF